MTETMTQEQAVPNRDPGPGDDPVWPADFAAMLDVKPSTIRHYTQQVTSGSPGTPVGFPMPDGRGLREVAASTPRQPTRRVRAAWWTRARAEEYARTRLPVGYQGKRDEAEG